MSLSDKKFESMTNHFVYDEDDVKEAIKKLKEKCGLIEDDTFALAIGKDDLIDIFGKELCSEEDLK